MKNLRNPLTVRNREEFLCSVQVGRENHVGLFLLSNLKELLRQRVFVLRGPFSVRHMTQRRHLVGRSGVVRHLSNRCLDGTKISARENSGLSDRVSVGSGAQRFGFRTGTGIQLRQKRSPGRRPVFAEVWLEWHPKEKIPNG
jgi:hypothetical protein